MESFFDGNIFSICARMFGTFMTLQREKIIYGVDTHPDLKQHNNLKNLLKIPFQKPT